MGKLSTHVLNTAAGIPAAGMTVEFRMLGDPGLAPCSVLRTDADGRCPALLPDGVALQAARYSLTFHVGTYFRTLGVELPDPPFLDEVVIAFGVSDLARNYHVPLLVSPWSYSTYRGS